MRTLPFLLLAISLVSPVRAQVFLEALAPPVGQSDGYFGTAVDGVPDVNGDGRGDLLIGAYNMSTGGRAYVFSGADGALIYELTSPNAESGGDFGLDVAGLQDVNGDGRGDFLIGAYQESPGSSLFAAGRAYVFSGATGALLRTLSSPNEELLGSFGYAVAGIPDVTGDGRVDLLVGALGEDPALSPDNAGRAYLYDGFSGTLRHTLHSPNEEPAGNFGAAVAGIPDVDGDGRGDLLVGAWYEDPGASPLDAGRAYVFSGASGTLLHELASPNEEAEGWFSRDAAGVGDVDGDGRGDLLIGASDEDGDVGAVDAGRAYVFSGATGVLLRELVSPNEEMYGSFGSAVAGVPDVDEDGRADLFVGAWGEDPDTSPDNAGRAYVFSGATGAVLYELTSLNEEPNGFFGVSGAGLEDVTGDGRGDLLIGASWEDPGMLPERAGQAYTFSGRRITATEANQPAASDLFAPHPNPSTSRASVAFTLSIPSRVRVAVYDVLGREVAMLVEGERAAGRHEVVFDSAELPAGPYLVRLEAGEVVVTRRLTLIR
jgi:hypothetical protein